MEGPVCLDLISSGFCQSVAPFPLCVPSRWMCLCLTFCLVLSALPVLACCVSPCLWRVKFGGQREVGFLSWILLLFVFSWLLFSSHIVTKPHGFPSGVRERLWPSQDYKQNYL